METLQVALYTDTYLPARDGVVTYIQILRKALQDAGHEVIVATVANRKYTYREKSVFYARGHHFPLYPQYQLSLLPFSMNKEIEKLHVDIVHTQTPFAIGFGGQRLSSVMGIPCLSTFHSLVFDNSVLSAYVSQNPRTISAVGGMIKRYLRWYYRRCNLVVSPSEHAAQGIFKELGIEAKVINNAVDIEKYYVSETKESARSRLSLNQEDRIILFLGRISREKNLEVLLQAARLVRNEIKFIILGSGPHLQYYKDYASDLGLNNVRFMGFVEDSLVPLYLRSADIFCNPSNFEVLSTVDIEAMAAGTPILVPEGSSQEELIFNGKSGMAFKNSDPEDLSARIEEMLSSDSTYETVKASERFSPEIHVKKLLEIYHNLLR